MRHGKTGHVIAVSTVCLMPAFVSLARADDGGSLTAPASDEQITALIRDLHDPAYGKRQCATRRLCAIGMPATRQLRTAMTGDDAETALRAKAILSVLDRLMLSGVEVRLSFSKARIAWNEPVDLTLTLTNPSDYAARIPFVIDTEARTESVDDARQVGGMLDVADLLHVRAPDGREVDLVVDDIAADTRVVAAVQERLNGGSSSLLQPGERVTVTTPEFNRGWARYRLLDAGDFTVVFDYTPEWEDDTLAAHRVGRVVSNPVTITVTIGAPPTVSRDGTEASLTLERQGTSLVARLTNHTDQIMLVNRDFGRSPPFAEGRWSYERNGTVHDIPVVPKRSASWHDFDAAMLAEVRPGQSVELTRIPVTDLRRELANVGAALNGNGWTIHFGYANLCDWRWQQRQGTALLGNPKAPPVFQERLPRRILSTRQTSNRLTAPRGVDTNAPRGVAP